MSQGMTPTQEAQTQKKIDSKRHRQRERAEFVSSKSNRWLRGRGRTRSSNRITWSLRSRIRMGAGVSLCGICTIMMRWTQQ